MHETEEWLLTMQPVEVFGILYLLQWSVITTYTGFNLYSPVVTLYTTTLSIKGPILCLYTASVAFVWISEQTAIIFLYSIN